MRFQTTKRKLLYHESGIANHLYLTSYITMREQNKRRTEGKNNSQLLQPCEQIYDMNTSVMNEGTGKENVCTFKAYHKGKNEGI